MNDYGYITFKSVSQAMKFETVIKNFNIKVKIIPVPRSISTSCGMCIRFILDNMEELLTIIEGEKLDYDEIYTNLK